VGYRIEDLPDFEAIIGALRRCGEFAPEHGMRTTFHPDQCVVLNSPRPDLVDKSIQDLEYRAEVAEWVGADVINIHGGGAYGDKPSALKTFVRNVARLLEAVRTRLTVENDDKVFTPKDLLPLCRTTGLPLVDDVHHHRCLPDGMSVEEATAAAPETWNREPLFHIASPLAGWSGPNPARHHDEMDLNDFPTCWAELDLTIEVEAKGKEVAVRRLQEHFSQQVRHKSQGDPI
jgi:UV DNA damage endonuclease